MMLDAASPAALLVQNNGATHSALTLSGGTLSIPNGGITISDSAHASIATFSGVIASANSLNLSPYGQLIVRGGQLSVPALTLNPRSYFLVDSGGSSPRSCPRRATRCPSASRGSTCSTPTRR